MFNKLDNLKDNLLFKLSLIKVNLNSLIKHSTSLVLMSVCIHLNFFGSGKGLIISILKLPLKKQPKFFSLESDAVSDQTFLYAHFLEHVAPV